MCERERGEGGGGGELVSHLCWLAVCRPSTPCSPTNARCFAAGAPQLGLGRLQPRNPQTLNTTALYPKHYTAVPDAAVQYQTLQYSGSPSAHC